MPRSARIIVPGCTHHITNRGNHREPVFGSDNDRIVYLRLVREYARYCNVAILGYALMPNHVHWLLTPADEHSLSDLFRRAHGSYSHYFHALRATSGRMWQNRFFCCPLGLDHLVRAMCYVELNAVRARLAHSAEAFPWSSARAHLTGIDEFDMLDLPAWAAVCGTAEWREILEGAPNLGAYRDLERATFSGKPFADDESHKDQKFAMAATLQLR
jgi:putative transposase